MLHRLMWVTCLFSTLLAGQAEKITQTVRASGEATVSAKPDRAEISFGVLTDAPTAEAASMQNANQSTQLLNTIKQVLGGAGQVRTANYSLAPDLQYAPNGGAPKITGYRANNTVLATVDDLSRVGKLLDAGMQAGGNEVGGISFTLRNDEDVRRQALAQAAQKARANADAIAKALGLRVLRVVQAETTNLAPIRPLTLQARAMQATAQAVTPVEPGTLDIHASVTLTVEVQ